MSFVRILGGHRAKSFKSRRGCGRKEKEKIKIDLLVRGDWYQGKVEKKGNASIV